MEHISQTYVTGVADYRPLYITPLLPFRLAGLRESEISPLMVPLDLFENRYDGMVGITAEP